MISCLARLAPLNVPELRVQANCSRWTSYVFPAHIPVFWTYSLSFHTGFFFAGIPSYVFLLGCGGCAAAQPDFGDAGDWEGSPPRADSAGHGSALFLGFGWPVIIQRDHCPLHSKPKKEGLYTPIGFLLTPTTRLLVALSAANSLFGRSFALLALSPSAFVILDLGLCDLPVILYAVQRTR